MIPSIPNPTVFRFINLPLAFHASDFNQITLDPSDRISFYDLSGRQVFQYQGTSIDRLDWQFSSLAPGVYYWVVFDHSNTIISSGLHPVVRL